MYCDKCHKQSPSNFVNCAYCGAKLESPDKKAPSKFVKKKKLNIKFSFKNCLIIVSVFAVALVLAAIFTASFTGTKPENVVKNFVKSTQSNDSELYYSLYDDNIKRYKQDNRYFGEDETFEQMVLPMVQSNEFYIEKCGEGYNLNYNVKSSSTLTEAKLVVFNEVLETSFGYIEFPARVDVLCVEIVANGSQGSYTSVYDDFWCMRIKGKWYKVDKTIYTEYLNTVNSNS